MQRFPFYFLKILLYATQYVEPYANYDYCKFFVLVIIVIVYMKTL